MIYILTNNYRAACEYCRYTLNVSPRDATSVRILLRPQDVQGVRLEPGDEDHEVYVSQGRIWGKETYLQLWEAWQVVRQTSGRGGELDDMSNLSPKQFPTWFEKHPTTLYRGEGSHDTPSYYPKTGPNAQAGAWWTSDADKARYLRSSGQGQRLPARQRPAS